MYLNHRQSFGVLFRSVKFSVPLTYEQISALLRGLQKMAASKPTIWLHKKKTSLISLNNNFGTFNFCSGLFPFRHTTLSYYVRKFKNNHCPSESESSLIKPSRPPNVCKLNIKKYLFLFKWNFFFQFKFT